MKDTSKVPQFKLRMPEHVKAAIAKKADEEGLSINSAIVQRLVRSLKQEEMKNAAVQ